LSLPAPPACAIAYPQLAASNAAASVNLNFAEALLRDGVDAMLSGDVDTGKTILRDYIKATVGFAKPSAASGAPPKSLIRMFGPRGNPQKPCSV
jgi:hypothetical protein